jgi:SAM-dependent methyltransferase
MSILGPKSEANAPQPYFLTRAGCPGCKSSAHRTLYTCGFLEPPIKEFLESFYAPQGGIELEYLRGALFVLKECQDCGLIFQRNIPNDFLVNKLYEEWIDPGKAFMQQAQNDDSERYKKYAEEVMLLIAYFNTVPQQLKFFDFGMGWGEWCLMARAFGCAAYGAELSEARIQYAKSQGITVIAWDEIPKFHFDFINTEQVFEHLPEPLDTLNYLKTALKPDGLIKISVPDGKDIKRNLQILDWTAHKESENSLNPVSPLEHLNCFTYRSLIQMAERAGFEPVNFPLILHYASLVNWRPLTHMLKNLLRPFYRNFFQRGTYVFFRQKRS